MLVLYRQWSIVDVVLAFWKKFNWNLIFGFFSMALKVSSNIYIVHLLLAPHNDYVLQNDPKNVVM